MATERAKQTIRVVTQEQMLCEDDGNVLLPLERVRDKYTRRADEIDEKMPGPGASDPADKIRRARMLDVAKHYRRCADSVQRLIGVINCATLVEPPAPVDQTEEIGCEFATLNTLLDNIVGEHEHTQTEVQ